MSEHRTRKTEDRCQRQGQSGGVSSFAAAYGRCGWFDALCATMLSYIRAHASVFSDQYPKLNTILCSGQIKVEESQKQASSVQRTKWPSSLPCCINHTSTCMEKIWHTLKGMHKRTGIPSPCRALCPPFSSTHNFSSAPETPTSTRPNQELTLLLSSGPAVELRGFRYLKPTSDPTTLLEFPPSISRRSGLPSMGEGQQFGAGGVRGNSSWPRRRRRAPWVVRAAPCFDSCLVCTNVDATTVPISGFCSWRICWRDMKNVNDFSNRRSTKQAMFDPSARSRGVCLRRPEPRTSVRAFERSSMRFLMRPVTARGFHLRLLWDKEHTAWHT